MNAAPHRAEAHSKRSAAELQLLSPNLSSTSGPKINKIKSPPPLSPNPAPAARARHQCLWPRGAVLRDTARAGASPVRREGGDRDRGRDWGRRRGQAAPPSPFSGVGRGGRPAGECAARGRSAGRGAPGPGRGGGEPAVAARPSPSLAQLAPRDGSRYSAPGRRVSAGTCPRGCVCVCVYGGRSPCSAAPAPPGPG